MKLKTILLDLQVGNKLIVALNAEDAQELGIMLFDRVEIKTNGKKAFIAIADIEQGIRRGEIGIYKGINEHMGLKGGESLIISPAEEPFSVTYIKRRMKGNFLESQEIKTIVEDTVARRLSNVELTAFITALDFYGLTKDEAVAMVKAMVASGDKINWGKNVVVDKHSVGGCPGDKTSLLVVPILASADFLMPKSSSRAITSPAGTADRAECLFPVTFSVDEVTDIVNKVGACMVWGGGLGLVPADQLFIDIQYALSINPLMLPSIFSKKIAMGSTHTVIDMPTGRGTKLKTIGQAKLLAKDFIDMGNRLGMKINCVITMGEQPIGNAIGPALEAREALQTLIKPNGSDLLEKATHVAGTLFDMLGSRDGKQKAMNIIKSGKAYTKMKEIIDAQGGNPKIKPDDVAVGTQTFDYISEEEGRVLWISNNDIVKLCRALGTPYAKGAGILLNKKMGDSVKKGDVLFTMYADKTSKLNDAEKILETIYPIGVAKNTSDKMLIKRLPSEKETFKRFFALEA